MINPLLSFTENKRIGFFGIGKSNLAIIEKIAKQNSEITIRSDGKIDKDALPHHLSSARIFEGDHSCDNIDEDVIFFSPSVRRDRRELLCALGRGVQFTSDIEFFIAHNENPLFTVTGSDGKTTTATLAARILSGDECPILPIGNIGDPACNHLLSKNTKFVLEASSFMLEYAAPTAKRAVITSLTPEHLSWHYGYDGYKNAKARAFQNADETVISADSPDLLDMFSGKDFFAVTGANYNFQKTRGLAKAQFYYCVEKDCITENGRAVININELKRNEIFNIKCYLSALALTKGYADEDRAIEVIRGFSGIEHRGEIFLEKNGIRFINSSIDTSPQRTAETLFGVSGNIILLLGGRSKGLDYTPLQRAVNDRNVKAIILFGEARDEIYSNVCSKEKILTESLNDAIKTAINVAIAGDTILLSPSATSYDEFSSFEERGMFFKNQVFSSF